jgi:hypothetical protein
MNGFALNQSRATPLFVPKSAPSCFISNNRLLIAKTNRLYLPLHRIIDKVRFWETLFDFRDQVVYFGKVKSDCAKSA